MRRALKAWPIFASAAMLLAAYPPLNLNLLVFVALVPWILSLRESTGWGAFRSGYLFGALFWLGQMHWLPVLVYRWTGSYALSVLPFVLCPIIGGLYFVGAASLIRLCWRANRAYLIPAVWAGIEVARSYVPALAFPWGLLGGPLYPFPPLIQLAHFGTEYLASAWVALANVLGALIVAGARYREIRVPALVFLLLLGLSIARFSTPIAGKPTTVTVGQTGVDLAFGDRREEPARIREAVGQLFAEATRQKSSLLVLPEGITGDGSFPPKVPFDIPTEMPVLFGGARGTNPRYQSAFGFDGEWKYADKTRLVIFGEYVPLRDKLPFLSSFNLPGGDLTPADKVQSIDVGGIRVGPLLCFEALFYDVALSQAQNNAQLLAVMSIDDWYMGTGAPEQLKSASVWRAVETGLPVVRSASMGYSLAIDQRGRVLSEAPLGKTTALRADLTLPEGPDRFPAAEAVPFVLLLSLVAPLLLNRRRKQSVQE